MNQAKLGSNELHKYDTHFRGALDLADFSEMAFKSKMENKSSHSIDNSVGDCTSIATNNK
jgi:hypothetical protein